MTSRLIQGEISPDAELVAESRRGNREAFGQIVRRYQGMVAGVTYSVCGDLHRSEDLAQETFIAAWKSLAEINEPEKLSPWLCQIARRKAVDFQRSQIREKNRLSRLFPPGEEKVSDSPLDEALTVEEREMLWRILSELPQPYRETMVLYYRQEQSTAAVALATETTEGAVRQRLARGRGMLREQVAQTLESNLIRSSPASAFATAVMLALPALAPQGAKAATVGAAAKGSAAIGGGALIAWVAFLSGPVLGLLIGGHATWRVMRSAKSARERRLIALYMFFIAACFVALFYVYTAPGNSWPGYLRFHLKHNTRQIAAMVTVSALAAVLIRLSRPHWIAIRSAQAPQEQGCESPGCQAMGKMPVWAIVAAVFSGTLWLAGDAVRARDWLGLGVVTAVIIALFAVSVYCWRSARGVVRRRYAYAFIPIMGASTLIISSWRLAYWQQIIDQNSHIQWTGLIPSAVFYLCIEVFLLAFLVGTGTRIYR